MNVWFQKILPYSLLPWKVIGNFEGGGGSPKPNILKERMKLHCTLEFSKLWVV